MAALTEPSSVAIHSLTTGTSFWTTGGVSTSGGGGGGGSRRRHPATATTNPTATSAACLTDAPSAGSTAPRLLRTSMPIRLSSFHARSARCCTHLPRAPPRGHPAPRQRLGRGHG